MRCGASLSCSRSSTIAGPGQNASTAVQVQSLPFLQVPAMLEKRELAQAAGRPRWLNSSRPPITRLLVPSIRTRAVSTATCRGQMDEA